MFTVIFLSRSARAIFERSRTFFDPFVESGTVAFCDWNESSNAVTLEKAVPALPEIIQGKAAWRAVVVDHAVATPTGRDLSNPFDFLENQQLELNLEDSPHALVRLAHQLLGYPAMTAQAFDPVVSYRALDGGRVEVPHAENGDYHEVLREHARTYSDVRVEYRKRPYTPEQIARHERLITRYQMKEVHPTEVVFVATRSPVSENSHSVLTRAWKTESEQSVSRFVDRNDYPAASRFAVYDLLNPENSGYHLDELRFWLSVLTVAVNELPPSSFQAERVYRLGIEFSDISLAELLNDHMSEVTSLREHLDSLIRRPERPPEVDVRDLLADQTVHVHFEKLGGNELAVATSGYGIASDEPRSESAAWAADFSEMKAKAELFIRKPRRVLARAVFDARRQSRNYLQDEYALTEIDREEIEEELVGRIRTLTEPATTAILDRERLRKLVDDEDKRVRRHISERMRMRTIATASTLVVVTWILAMTPYLLQAARKNQDALLWSAFVVAVIVLAIAGVGIVTLLWMRARFIELLRAVNSSMRGFVAGVSGGAVIFGNYLSALATYMQARALLINAGRMQEREQAQLRRLHTIRGQAIAAIAAEKQILSSLGQPLSIRRVPLPTPDFDVNDERAVTAIFRFPPGDRRAEYNSSGEFVTAPYDFIRALRVDRVRLFETTPDLSDD